MMERHPEPFFRQGPSANTRLFFFVLLALALMIADSKWNATASLRETIGNVLYPVQRTLLVPRDLIQITSDYVDEVGRLRDENAQLRRAESLNARAMLEHEQLVSENRRLRELAGARARVEVRSTLAQVLYETRDPFSRKLVLDRGINDGISLGQPVIEARGLVGQITRAYQHSSEMSLITDAAMTVPVQVQRSGLRSVAFGSSKPGMLELRYLAGNADLRKGDVLTTSGLDAVYPAGIPVGEVADIERGGPNDVARAFITPAARVSNTGMMIVLQVDTSMIPPLPPPEPGSDTARPRTRH